MIANPRVNHRLSWWSYPLLLAAMAVLPCVPVHGQSDELQDSATPQRTRPSGASVASQMTTCQDGKVRMFIKGKNGRTEILKQGITLSVPVLPDSVLSESVPGLQGVTGRSKQGTFKFFVGFSR